MTGSQNNPAEIAAKESMEKVLACVDANRSFVLEAGAGAGKTYSLIGALKYLIKNRGSTLIRERQQIACITYTNVAKEEITNRIDNHPAVVAETIHSFCWSLLKDFQPHLRAAIPGIGKWNERIAEQGEIGNKKVVYDLGYPKIDEEKVLLHHNDVLSLMVKLMQEKKFRTLFYKRFPIVFIDEYQDTDKEFVNSLKEHFIQTQEGPLLGFFGDHWQKIYGTSSCGKIEHEHLITIEKKANFRSERKIVECLNRLRSELPQHVRNPDSTGDVMVFHSNNWEGTRRAGGHWAGDLPPEVSRSYLNLVRQELTAQNWLFEGAETKVLMLTHNVLSEEQGYHSLAEVFSRTESYIKKEDDYISFFADTFEPAFVAYQNLKFGEMFLCLGSKNPAITSHSKKNAWTVSMNALRDLRSTGTIGDVLAHLSEAKLPRLPESIDSKERKVVAIAAKGEADRTDDEKEFLERIVKLKAVPYREVIALTKFIDDKTPFATKHGVKGAEFENVLVIFGRGWNQYNFNQMLEWVGNGIPADKQESFERNRNLFYVACSRPKKRLALLFTQKLSDVSLGVLANWFGTDSVKGLPNVN